MILDVNRSDMEFLRFYTKMPKFHTLVKCLSNKQIRTYLL